MERNTMKNFQTPFRYDFVGSFLRPEAIKRARAEFEAGKITAEELKAVEDTCIRELVEKQKAAGYPVITDGEFRRATWHLHIIWSLMMNAPADSLPVKLEIG